MIICAYPPANTGLVSRFGMRRGRVTGAQRMHAGIDLRARRGDPLFAACDGTVAVIGRDEPHGRVEGGRFVGGGPLAGYGNCVAIRDDEPGWFPFLCHMETVLVSVGQRVQRGQRIGTVGSTSNGKFDGSPTSLSPGRPMGAHAHFEIGTRPPPKPYGQFVVDPVPWLANRGVTYGMFGSAPTILPFCQRNIPVSGLGDGEYIADEYEPVEEDFLLSHGPMLVGFGGVALLGGAAAWLYASYRE